MASHKLKKKKKDYHIGPQLLCFLAHIFCKRTPSPVIVEWYFSNPQPHYLNISDCKLRLSDKAISAFIHLWLDISEYLFMQLTLLWNLVLLSGKIPTPHLHTYPFSSISILPHSLEIQFYSLSWVLFYCYFISFTQSLPVLVF